ncbi:MAG: hypothetical protein RL196_900 [Actinomycetota bacterium]|jgi:hypothetical protein
MLNLNPDASFGTPVKCSRAGCLVNAEFQVVWNNPKVHDADRRKIWLACLEHREYLVDYLSTRSFYLETLEIDHK